MYMLFDDIVKEGQAIDFEAEHVILVSYIVIEPLCKWRLRPHPTVICEEVALFRFPKCLQLIVFESKLSCESFSLIPNAFGKIVFPVP